MRSNSSLLRLLGAPMVFFLLSSNLPAQPKSDGSLSRQSRCANLSAPGADEIREMILDLARRLDTDEDAVNSAILCENNSLETTLRTRYSPTLIIMDFDRDLLEQLNRESAGRDDRPDIEYSYQTLIAINRLSYAHVSHVSDALDSRVDPRTLVETLTFRDTGTDLAGMGYPVSEFDEMGTLLRAPIRSMGPEYEDRLDVMRNSFHRAYSARDPEASAPSPQPRSEHQSTPEPVRSWWQNLAELISEWMGSIAKIGGGIAVLYGLWRWWRKRQRSRRTIASAREPTS